MIESKLLQDIKASVFDGSKSVTAGLHHPILVACASRLPKVSYIIQIIRFSLSSSAILWGRLHEKSAFDQYKSAILPDSSILEYIFPNMTLLLPLLTVSLKPMVKHVA